MGPFSSRFPCAGFAHSWPGTVTATFTDTHPLCSRRLEDAGNRLLRVRQRVTHARELVGKRRGRDNAPVRLSYGLLRAPWKGHPASRSKARRTAVAVQVPRLAVLT